MHQLLTPAREIRTDRLLLAPLTPADVDDLRRVLGEPGRPVALVDAQHLVQESIGSRVRHGLGPWAVRRPGDDRMIGVGGVTMIDHGVWLLDWHLPVGADRQDLAAELLQAAVEAAARTSAAVPVAALVSSGADDRGEVLCRAGFSCVHRASGIALWADHALEADQRAAVLSHS